MSVSPQGLELFRRRIRVTVSPPDTWVLNLGAGDQDQLSHRQHTPCEQGYFSEEGWG